MRPPSEEYPNPSPRVLGFVIRDLGGIRVHPPTLNASISSSLSSSPFEFLPEHCIVTSTVQEAAKKLYHTLVHNQLQRLVRVLGLHYDGRGWEIVRREIERNVGRDTWLWKVWMEGEGGRQVESVQGKCLLRMKMQGLYRDVSCNSQVSRCAGTNYFAYSLNVVRIRRVPEPYSIQAGGRK